MVSLIIGHKGSGKTKILVDNVNDAVEKSNGNVICVEKETKLTYDVSHRARLVSTDSYSVSGFDAFYGFLSGLCAGDHDITDILVDATFRIMRLLRISSRRLTSLQKSQTHTSHLQFQQTLRIFPRECLSIAKRLTELDF